VPPPDAAITKFEDETIARQNATERKTYLGLLPLRPAYGKQGKPITLRTNFFTLNLTKSDLKLYRYDISYVPPTPALSAPKKRRYIQLLLDNPLFKNVAASDYSTIIITTRELPLGPDKRKRFSIVTYDKYEPSFPAPSANEPQGRQAARMRRTRGLQVEYSTTYAPNELFDFLRSVQPGATFTATNDIIQALNIVFKRAPNFHRQVARAGQNKFYPYGDQYINRHPLEASALLGEGLKALRGVYSSVRLGPNRALVNINVASGVFYQESKLSTLISSFGGPSPSGARMRLLQDFLRRLRVVTEHMKNDDNTANVRKVHTIDSQDALAQTPRLGANSNEVHFFWNSPPSGQARQVSVRQYFKLRESKHPDL
jgi:eukaryotic translation initiation factor 2C